MFEKYPYTNFHDLNLDWIITQIKRIDAVVDDFVAYNKLVWAGTWSGSKYYLKWSIVSDANGDGYVAIKYVPENISLSNTDYWQPVANFSALYSAYEQRIQDLEADSASMAGDISALQTSVSYLETLELQSTHDSTDRKAEIEAMLSNYGRVYLGEGIFWVSGVVMPQNSILRGCGPRSQLCLLPSVASGAALTMGSQCQVSNMAIRGDVNPITINSTVGSRHGIEWTGTGSTGYVTDVVIDNFTGGGIYCHDTGASETRSLLVKGARCFYNKVGLYIRRDSEYNEFVDCVFSHGYFGIVNRGGNNMIGTSLIADNEYGLEQNSIEGSNGGRLVVSGCAINHNTTRSVRSALPDLILDGCQIHYGELEILSNALVSSCIFGVNTPITVSSVDPTIFNGCKLRSIADNPTTLSASTKVDACYYNDGSSVTP